MGRVTGSYGLQGWVRILPYSAQCGALAAYADWWIAESAVRVEETREHGAALLAKLAGVESREQALQLKGAEIAVPREAFAAPAAGEYYYADLVGLEVVNARGERLGRIAALSSNGAHDVMELSGDRVRLLPWIPQVVKSVDLAGRRVDVEWEADW